MGSAPSAPLKALPRIQGTIDSLPYPLREALKEPADFDEPDECVGDVLSREDSACFLLDLPVPHPSLSHFVVWRLPPFEEVKVRGP